MSEQKQLSLCIITRNEESLLPSCLKEMEAAADEIIVADLGSDDRTVELARNSGASVYRLDWKDDFGQIKNFCMDRADGKWVLFLQADELIFKEQLQELKMLMQNPAAEAYIFDVEKKQKGLEISSPAQLVRLIRNRKNYRFCYRSFEYIPDEEIYSVQNSGMLITHCGETETDWQLEERLRLLELDLKENPQDGYVCYLEGIRLINQKKYKEGAEFLERSRRVFNGGYLYTPHLYKCLSGCLLALGRNEDAEEVLTEGFKLFPFYTDILVLRARLLHKVGRDEEAINDLQTCLAIRNVPSINVPATQIDVSEIEKQLESIRTGMHEEY